MDTQEDKPSDRPAKLGASSTRDLMGLGLASRLGVSLDLVQKLRLRNESIARLAEQLRSPLPDTSGPLLAQLAGLRAQARKEQELLDRVDKLSKELSRTKEEKGETDKQLQQTLAEYAAEREMRHLVRKVSEEAVDKIRADAAFRGQFSPGKLHDAFVMSVDIRSSTQLMLNAKDASDFAAFVTELCDKLGDIVVSNGGILDKFTGDGVLAFFPTFYSGDDAGYRAVLAATEAIEFFVDHYRNSRECFKVVIEDTGLGIGIDYGKVQLVDVGGSLSVVGEPVVYACRFSAAPAGSVYVNQPAKEALTARYAAHITVAETSLYIKGSGSVIAYEVKARSERMVLTELPWRATPSAAT